jgi:hypothetical protein
MVQAAQGLGDVAMVLAGPRDWGMWRWCWRGPGTGGCGDGNGCEANQRAGWAEGREAKSGFPALVENGFACPSQRPRLMINC